MLCEKILKIAMDICKTLIFRLNVGSHDLFEEGDSNESPESYSLFLV